VGCSDRKPIHIHQTCRSIVVHIFSSGVLSNSISAILVIYLSLTFFLWQDLHKRSEVESRVKEEENSEIAPIGRWKHNGHANDIHQGYIDLPNRNKKPWDPKKKDAISDILRAFNTTA
jgi:hypothetical protein